MISTLSGVAADPPGVPTTGQDFSGILPCGPGPMFTLPANTPFFVRHGWNVFNWTDPTQTPSLDRSGLLSTATSFVLFVDGAPVPSLPLFGVTQSFLPFSPNPAFVKDYIANFPEGLSGPHAFDGRWYEDASLLGGTFGQSVLASECTATVDFL